MFKFFIFCYSFPFCERAVGSKETTIVPFSDYYFNTITLSVQESRGRRGIPPLEPLLPRRPSGESPPSLRLRDSAERLNKIFFRRSRRFAATRRRCVIGVFQKF